MMNNKHLRTHSVTETTDNGWSSHVDVLNSVMDPIDVLSDADLQNELSLYANAQFTFDTAPGVAVEDKPNSVSSFGLYRQPSSHSHNHHHHQQQQQHQTLLSLDIPLSTGGTVLNDTTSPTLSSPYDQRQHYCSPLSSLPASPTKLDGNDGRQLDPLLSFMLLSTDHQQQQHSHPSLQQDPQHHPSSIQLNPVLPETTNDVTLKTDHQVLTRKKESTSVPRRRTQSTPARQRQLSQSKKEHSLLDVKKTTVASKKGNKKQNKAGAQHTINPLDGDNNKGDDSDTGDFSTYQHHHQDDDDDGSGILADNDLVKLDKRRRNTAASARFRIKKKMREQSLQRTACEMTEKAKVLENRVHELEREVKWLKDLVVAKNGS